MPTSTGPQLRPQWVVVDTNAFGSGHLQRNQIENLARELEPVGVQVVVPEVVLWEWAEHAHRDLTELELAVAPVWNRLGRAGLADLHPPRADQHASVSPDVRKVVERIGTILTDLDNVRILPASAAGALAGLRSQVLQTGAGKRKPPSGGTKTGAADTAWVFDAFELAEHDPDRLLFLTSDKDVASACAELGIRAPKMCRRHVDVVNVLRELKVVSERESAQKLAHHLLAALPSSASTTFPVKGLYIPPWAGDGLRRASSSVEMVLSVTLARLSGIARVDDTRTDGKLTTAALTMIGDVDLALSTTPLDGVIEIETVRYHGVVFDVPIAASVNGEGLITDVSAAGWVDNLATGDLSYADVRHALDDLVETLGAHPTLPDATWWRELFQTGHGLQGADDLHSMHGRTPRATRTHWEFTLLVGDGHELTITVGPNWDRPDGSVTTTVHVMGVLEPIDDFTPAPLLGTTAIAATVAELRQQGR